MVLTSSIFFEHTSQGLLSQNKFYARVNHKNVVTVTQGNNARIYSKRYRCGILILFRKFTIGILLRDWFSKGKRDRYEFD